MSTGTIVRGSDVGSAPVPTGSAMTMAVSTRAAQEVQAAMVIAKQFPRDQTAAMERIKTSCQRKALAEQSQYSYPRGGKKVTGPSIRLAEALAQGWGNIDFGVIELETGNGQSTMMSYAWDLETNSRRTMVFIVRHSRKANQVITQLDDPRDIYEHTANNAARRMRACILAVIPGDVCDAAIEQCNKTLAGDGSEPLIDRLRKMVRVFSALGVSQEMIEARLGHKLEACIPTQLVELRGVYQSLKDGMSKREDWFSISTNGAPENQATGGDFAQAAPTPAEPQAEASPPPVATPEETPQPAPPQQAPAAGPETLARYIELADAARSPDAVKELVAAMQSDDAVDSASFESIKARADKAVRDQWTG